jgi:hypothetical protein
MVKSINYFWVLPTLSIRVKGKRFTFECWIVSRFSVRWSSSSTILTLMAWCSNILQKSFVRDCSSLLKNDLRFTGRWQSLQLAVACCAFCALFMCYQKCLNFAVLKVLPSGDWWVLAAVSVEVHQSLFLRWSSVLSSILFVGGTPDRSVMMLLSGFDWCIQWLRSCRLLFLRWISFLK